MSLTIGGIKRCSLRRYRVTLRREGTFPEHPRCPVDDLLWLRVEASSGTGSVQRIPSPQKGTWRKYRRLDHVRKHPAVSLEVVFGDKSLVT